MTKFASSYPDRVRGLVYLDAAYDRTNLPPEGSGAPENPRQADLASLSAYRDFIQRTRGMRLPESELRWTVVTDESGHLLRGAIPSTTPQAILRGLERPDYEHVHVPALAIYQPDRSRDALPNGDAHAEKMIQDSEAFVEHSMDQFRREVAHGRVVRLTTGSHYLFITNENEVVRLIREFLAAT
jgi:pimeloyl-ACP methyl ester carboxylesterase